jgi:D-sedoheptulose 7-phosphate isomerase
MSGKMFSSLLKDHIKCLTSIAEIEPDIENAGEILKKALVKGNKILICGNGGSAADAQHFAAELVGRFEKERQAFPAIALTTDTSNLTAIGNDYGYNRVFSRQVEALGLPGDILLCISTSGNSENLLLAAEAASEKGLKTIGLLGKEGGLLKKSADLSITVRQNITARIQEAHIFILHYWAALIENDL